VTIKENLALTIAIDKLKAKYERKMKKEYECKKKLVV